MPKINHQKTYNEHYGRIDGYAQMIDAIFQKANEEAVKIALATGHAGNQSFSFAHYPQTKKKIDRLLQSVAANIQSVILNGEAAEWDFSNLKNDALVASVFGSKANFKNTRYARYFNRNEKALAAFQQRRINGLNLSDKVWKLTEQYQQNLELALDIGIRDGRSAAELSRDVREFLNEPDKLFRRIRDEQGDLELSKNALAYRPGPETYRSAYKNAMRLTRTEINMAYRTADEIRWEQLDFVVGYEVKRSNNPYPCSVCEALAGKYPKDFHFVGWHPHCRCYVVPILKTVDEMDEDSDLILEGKEPIKYTDSANAVNDVPNSFKKWVNENKERAQNWKSMPYFIQDNAQFGGLHKIIIEKGQRGATEFNVISQHIAEKLKVTVTPVNLKSERRIMEKARLDYNGDISKVKDMMRNTFITEDSRKESVIAEIRKEFTIMRMKEHKKDIDPLGYSGILINAKTTEGVNIEIQINTPAMIYGKEVNPEKFIGARLCKQIRELTGLEPGRGHKLYERYRVLDSIKDLETRKKIEQECRNYYNQLRKLKL